MAIESALKERYDKDVVPALMERFHYKNPLEVPRLVKVVVNMGVGDAVGNPKALEAAVDDLTRITGQRPLVTRAKKSIASFKIRTGMPIGAKVTLRGQRMYDFVEKLFFMALPRCVTSGAYRPGDLTAGVTTPWESRSKLFFRKSSTTRLTSCGEWTSR